MVEFIVFAVSAAIVLGGALVFAAGAIIGAG